MREVKTFYSHDDEIAQEHVSAAEGLRRFLDSPGGRRFAVEAMAGDCNFLAVVLRPERGL